jgi:hypothetical protein
MHTIESNGNLQERQVFDLNDVQLRIVEERDRSRHVWRGTLEGRKHGSIVRESECSSLLTDVESDGVFRTMVKLYCGFGMHILAVSDVEAILEVLLIIIFQDEASQGPVFLLWRWRRRGEVPGGPSKSILGGKATPKPFVAALLEALGMDGR